MRASNLPPGVTDAMIEEHATGEREAAAALLARAEAVKKLNNALDSLVTLLRVVGSGYAMDCVEYAINTSRISAKIELDEATHENALEAMEWLRAVRKAVADVEGSLS